MERELERPRERERATGQENFPDDFSLRLVPIFFVMWRAKNEQRRKGIGRGELESRAWDGGERELLVYPPDRAWDHGLSVRESEWTFQV